MDSHGNGLCSIKKGLSGEGVARVVKTTPSPNSDTSLDDLQTVPCSSYIIGKGRLPSKPRSPAEFDISGLDFLLVGKGKRGEGCGNIIPLSCQACLKNHFVKSSCKQKGCPDCWRIWLRDTTKKVALRLTSEVAKRRNPRMRLTHVVISPDLELIREQIDVVTYVGLREKALKYLYGKSNKVPSGVLIFHPFRPNERYYRERGEERRGEERRR